ncbi:MAG: extracellular solute-binding protein [Ruminococcus sp.]|nr:extracellular solute-binding protein [Ruminococcus sp.]
MKNSLITRSVTGVLAVAMVFSAYSCGEKKNDGENSSNSQAEQTAKETITNSYSSIDIETEIPAEYVEQMFLIKGTSQVLITGGDSNGNTKLYLTDVDFSGFNEISLDFQKPENSQSYIRTTVAPDGSIYALLTIIDYGDFKIPDYDDPDFDYKNFDYEAMNKAAEYSYTLYKLGSDGKIISENPVTNVEEYSEDSEDMRISVRDITACSDGNIILSLSGEEETYCILKEDGEITGKIDVGSDTHWINYFGNDSDGNVVCAGYGSNGEALEYIDIEAKKFSDDSVNVSLENSEISGINSISTGTGEYTLFTSTQAGLYGIDKDKKPVEIINWIDSDITGDSVRSVIGLDDGDFIVYLQDYTSNTSGFARLTKRSADELANQTVITLGMLYSDSAITSRITDFNKSHTDYRIKIADYSKYDEYDDEKEKMINSASKQLKMDIVSGNAPDMIVTYDYSLISELAPKGTFTDLSTYLEKDADLSADDIMPNVLSASKIDGKLYSLSPSFGVTTMACKTKFFDKENWTLDEMIDTYHEHPDMQLCRYGNSKESAFELICGSMVDKFIDYEKAECHFDSDDFKKVLEFCNEFPDEDEEIDWENASQDEIEAYWNEQDTLLLNDKALLDTVNLYTFTEYGVEKDAYFNDDITLVGIPSNDGNGAILSFNNSMAVLESSQSKDACWAFIKEFFTEEYQTNNQYSSELPSLVSAFEKKAEESMSKPYYLDENGKKVEYDNTYFINGKEINVKPLTKEQKDFVVDYIKKADRVTGGFSDDVREIVVEEVTKYFKGEADSQQAIDKIQSRVGILISEQS